MKITRVQYSNSPISIPILLVIALFIVFVGAGVLIAPHLQSRSQLDCGQLERKL